MEVDIIRSTTSEVIIKCLDAQFARHGVPTTLRTDNGSNLVSAEMEEYLKEMGVEHKLTTPLWPRANGEVERQNRSLLKAMRAAHAEKRNWRMEMNKYLLAYRSTAHTTTGKSPAELLLGRSLSTKLPDIGELGETGDNVRQQNVRDRDAEKKQAAADYADQRRQSTERDLGTGDLVLLEKKKENKLSPAYEGEPYRVTARYGDQIHIESSEGVKYKRNIQHLKRFNPATQTQQQDSDEPPGEQVEVPEVPTESGKSCQQPVPDPGGKPAVAVPPRWSTRV